ncbi:MAG: hypothetical protein A2Y96_00435 [Firmicutes bacterium RBG_13_65_8]|nr:MAG: hypothetical protein A2Y96_00435 [Firmicutes bacterium RBG_13_65_8]
MREGSALQILEAVFSALSERGYDPVAQLAGYLLSGDPTYITAHRNARSLVQRHDRADLLAELLREYVGNLKI